MPTIKENLDGGLVTADDPSQLEPGELSEANNVIYKPNSKSLHRAPHRTLFSAAPVTASITTTVRLAGVSGDTIIAVAGLTQIAVGMTVTGTSIPAATTVTFVNLDTQTLDGPKITISAALTGALASGATLTFTVVTITSVLGLAAMTFDNGNRYLLSHYNDGTFYRASVGTTGTWTLAETQVSGNYLDGIQYNNKYFLLNGAKNRVWYLKNTATSANPSQRPHGLAPVLSTPSVVTAAGTASVTAFGYYEYWTTEVLRTPKDASNYFTTSFSPVSASAVGSTTYVGTFSSAISAGDRMFGLNVPNGCFVVGIATAFTSLTADLGATSTATANVTFERGAFERLESAFGGDPSSLSFVPSVAARVNVATSATKATITLPGLANSNATHWKIYRSPKMDLASDTLFPVGYDISGDIPLSTTSWIDQGVVTSASKTTTSGVNINRWSNPANLSATGTNWATVNLRTNAIDFNDNEARALNFGFTTIADPIQGLTVTIQSTNTAIAGFLGVRISPDGGQRWSQAKSARVIVGAADYVLGSSIDTWGGILDAKSINSNNLIVSIMGAGTGGPLSANNVRVAAYGNASPGSATQPFPATVITVDGVTASSAANGQPPTAETGAIFQDCMVLNDIAQPSFIRWSLAGQPECFPWAYFMQFETADNDKVTNVKSIGNRMVVGLQRSLWRVNYLPNEDDARFNRGRAIDLISSDKGVVNPKAAAYFINAEGRLDLAFVSAVGVYTTDGFSIREAAPDIRWSDVFAGMNMYGAGTVLLESNPLTWDLTLYLTTPTGFPGTVAYKLNYHPTHIKQGGYMKVTGPIYVTHADGGGNAANVRSAVTTVDGSGTVRVYQGYNGVVSLGAAKVYHEGGYTLPANVNPGSGYYNASIKTRGIYPAGIGGEWKLDDLYVHHQAPDTGALLTTGADVYRTRQAETADPLPTNITTAFVGFDKAQPCYIAEGVRIHITDNPNGSLFPQWVLDFLALKGSGFGREESA